jgi:hypothetical protein
VRSDRMAETMKRDHPHTLISVPPQSTSSTIIETRSSSRQLEMHERYALQQELPGAQGRIGGERRLTHTFSA